MNLHGKDIKIFSGNSNRALAEEIAEKIGLPVGVAIVRKFSDGECEVNIGEVVRGSDVFVLQSICTPVNDNLVELLIMIDALKRASAGRITAVIPYYGYARQDRKAKARDPISAKLVANLITVAGADRVLTMDFHTPQLQGFFDIPVDHLIGVPILAEYFKGKFEYYDDLVVVSPDVGSVDRARKFAQRLDIPLAIIDKRRPKANVSEIMNIIGDVRDKRVIIVDDLIDTGGTLVNAAKALSDIGATEVYACCSHGVLSGPAIERIKDSPLKELVTLNTIPLPKEKQIDKIKVLSVAAVFAEAIERIYGDMSISTLFTQQEELKEK
ncbi:MAG: ribose-phosphate pyrophosphokinase [Clostridiales bacterium]|jgi:ribose-phosphate pyrophosphokinase|nr:ribose-phosphate pyrophosphokinase [Eubacteriales bacterium]MDH7567033.1 ribose-phosphate pyrophosphokinase [Clostridiales bacterium]